MYTFTDQIIIGTILGGSSFVKPKTSKNYYLSMRDKNEDWLFYKMAELEKYFPRQSLLKYGVTYRCNSICSEDLTKLKKILFVKNKRIVTMDLLDSLKDICLAVWYLDNGGKTGRNNKNAYINTTKLGENGTKLINQYFCEIGMFCKIHKEPNRQKVLFSVEGTQKLFKTIGHCFPVCMYHRF